MSKHSHYSNRKTADICERCGKTRQTNETDWEDVAKYYGSKLRYVYLCPSCKTGKNKTRLS